MLASISGVLHGHPIVTVAVFTTLAFAIFVWALLAGAEDIPQAHDIQTGGDWAWPKREVG